jgi:hypothetical protein
MQNTLNAAAPDTPARDSVVDNIAHGDIESCPYSVS